MRAVHTDLIRAVRLGHIYLPVLYPACIAVPDPDHAIFRERVGTEDPSVSADLEPRTAPVMRKKIHGEHNAWNERQNEDKHHI